MMLFKLAAFTVNQNSTLMYFSTFVGRFDQFMIGMLAAHVPAPPGRGCGAGPACCCRCRS
jgi:hypothetical protein